MNNSILYISFVLGALFFNVGQAQQIDPPSMQLSTELQDALEVDSVADHLQGIVVLCANACEPKSSSKPTSVRKQMQDLKATSSPREKGSGMATGKRQHKPMNVTKPSQAKHDTGMAIIRKIGAMSCSGAAKCVDMIARKNKCKAGTVKCTSTGCSCTVK